MKRYWHHLSVYIYCLGIVIFIWCSHHSCSRIIKWLSMDRFWGPKLLSKMICQLTYRNMWHINVLSCDEFPYHLGKIKWSPIDIIVLLNVILIPYAVKYCHGLVYDCNLGFWSYRVWFIKNILVKPGISNLASKLKIFR